MTYHPDWIGGLGTAVALGLSVFVATKLSRRRTQGWIIGVSVGVVVAIVLRSILRRFGM